MNSEIVHRLTSSYKGYLGGTPEESGQLLDQLLTPGSIADPEGILRRMGGLLKAQNTLLAELENGLRPKRSPNKKRK